MSKIVPAEDIETKIFFVRGHKVMISPDLAKLYEIEPRSLVQAVKRNIERFPDDFMFQLTIEEYKNLKSHFVTSSRGGVRRAMPYAFTEQGVAMLSSVLKSKRAIEVNIAIMRAFVKLRKMLASNEELKRKLAAMERKYDSQFKVVFDAIKQLMKESPVTAIRLLKFVIASASEAISSLRNKGDCRVAPLLAMTHECMVIHGTQQDDAKPKRKIEFIASLEDNPKKKRK